jgi:hypothetical protein
MAKRRKTIPRTAGGKYFPTQEFPLREDCVPMCMSTPQAILIFTICIPQNAKARTCGVNGAEPPATGTHRRGPKPIFWLRSYRFTGANPTTNLKSLARTKVYIFFTYFTVAFGPGNHAHADKVDSE